MNVWGVKLMGKLLGLNILDQIYVLKGKKNISKHVLIIWYNVTTWERTLPKHF